MSGKQPPESGSSNSSKDLPGILDFLSSVFPETNVETLAALLSAAGDDPTRVADRLIRQEAIDHQECVVDIATGEEEDPLAMLQSVYPLLSPSLIQSAWIRCNGDVALAAEHLLNPSEEIPLTARILPPKAERGNSGDIVLQVPKKSKNGKTSSSNDTTDALTLQLAAVFPDQPLDLLRQVLQESQGKLDVAAMKVSQWTLDDFRKEPDLKPRASRDVASLQTLFPSRSKATLESLLERYGHLDAVVDYLSMVDESAVGFSDKDLADLCEGDCISSGFPCLLHASDSATTRASLPIGSKRETWNGEAALDVFQRDPTYGASSTHRSSNHRRTTSSNHESQVSTANIVSGHFLKSYNTSSRSFQGAPIQLLITAHITTAQKPPRFESSEMPFTKGPVRLSREGT